MTQVKIIDLDKDAAEKKKAAALRSAAEGKKIADNAADDKVAAGERLVAEQQRQAEQAAGLALEPLLNALESVQTELSGVFEDVFSGAIRNFDDAADAMKNIGVRLASDLAAALVVTPTINLAVGGLSSLLNAGATAGLSGPPQSPLGSLGGSIFGEFAGSAGKSLASRGLVSNLGGAINRFGASIGFGSGGGAGAALGSFCAAQEVGVNIAGSLTPATLTSVLGAAGIGALGGGILADLRGGNQIGGTVGGALGAGAGFALGSQIAALGSLGGPIGAPIGGLGLAFGGSLLGGGGPSVGPNAFTQIGVNRSGRASIGGNFTDNGGDAAVTIALARQANAAINDILNTFNLSLTAGANPRNTIGGISFFSDPDPGSGQPGGFFIDPDSKGPVFPTGEGAVNALILEVLQKGQRVGRVRGASPEVASALRNSQATDVAGLVSDLQFAQGLSDIDLRPEEISEVERALAAVNDQFEALADRARSLGISTRDLNAAQAVAIDTLRADAEENARLAILQIENPQAFSLRALEKTFDEMREGFEALGADVGLINERERLERLEITERFAVEERRVREQANQAMLRDLQSAATDAQREALGLAGEFSSVGQSALAFGSSLPFSSGFGIAPARQLEIAQQRFTGLSRHAIFHGSLVAGREAQALAPRLLEFASEFSPAQAPAIFRHVSSNLSVIGGTFERRAEEERSRAQRAIALAEEGVDLSNRVANGVEASKAELAAMRAEISDLRRENQSLADALAAVVNRAVVQPTSIQ